MAADYIRSDRPIRTNQHPVQGGFDKAFKEQRDTPETFLGPWQDHVDLNLRSYYYNQDKYTDDRSGAWVIGGWLGYNTGKWKDTVGFGAKLYSSNKIWGPEDKDGTGLLKPDQTSFTVLGELFVEADFAGLNAWAGRREMNLPFINKEDIRQVPITHQAYMLSRNGTDFDFVVGHVSKQKNRDSDDFKSMSETTGVNDKDRGVTLAGTQLTLAKDLRFGIISQYGHDLYNTAYTDLLWDRVAKNTDDWSYHLGTQYVDQRSVGDELAGDYNAQQFGLRGGLGRKGQSVLFSYTTNSDDGEVKRDYGGTPMFNGMIIEKFDTADESALGVHYKSHFADFGLPEWAAGLGVVAGSGSKDVNTGASVADKTEYDATLDYKPTGKLKGLWVRLRYINVDFDSGEGHTWNTRVIVNYEFGAKK
jgi:hypothetical protein